MRLGMLDGDAFGVEGALSTSSRCKLLPVLCAGEVVVVKSPSLILTRISTMSVI